MEGQNNQNNEINNVVNNPNQEPVGVSDYDDIHAYLADPKYHEKRNRWFDDFKKLLHSKGINTADPVSTALIRGFTVIVDNKDGDQVTEETFYPVGGFKQDAKQRDDEIKAGLTDIAKGRSLNDFKKGTAIDNLPENDIDILYSLAVEGRLYFLDKSLDFQTGSTIVYTDDEGGLNYFEGIGNTPGLDNRDVFRGIKDKRGRMLFDRICNYKTALETRFGRNDLGMQSDEIIVSESYGFVLLKHYMADPSLFDNTKFVENFEHALRIGSAVASNLPKAREAFDSGYSYISRYVTALQEFKKLGFESIKDAITKGAVTVEGITVEGITVEYDGDPLLTELKLISDIMSGKEVCVYTGSDRQIKNVLTRDTHTGEVISKDRFLSDAEDKLKEYVSEIINIKKNNSNFGSQQEVTVAKFLALSQLINDYPNQEFNNDDERKEYFSDIKILNHSFKNHHDPVYQKQIERIESMKPEEVTSLLSDPARYTENVFRSERESREILEWFKAFKKDLIANDIDTADPVSTALIRGAISSYGNYSQTTTSFIAFSENMPPKFDNDITDGKGIQYFKENFRAIDNFTAADIRKLYNYAKEGNLFFLGKNMDNANGRHYCYLDNDGKYRSVRIYSDPGMVMKSEEAKNYSKLNPEDIFEGISRSQAINLNAQIRGQHGGDIGHAPTTMMLGGPPYVAAGKEYETNLLIDYFEHPEYYKDKEMSKYRTEMVKNNTLNKYSIPEESEEFKNYTTLDSEKSVLAEIQQAYGLDKLSLETLNKMAQQGCFVHPDGTTFNYNPNPFKTLSELTQVFATHNGNRIVLMNKSFDGHIGSNERLGVVSLKSGKIKFNNDGPTKGNDYDLFTPQYLEKPEPSDELVKFLNSLAVELEKAGIDLNNLADRTRLKAIVYESGKSRNIERLPLADMDFRVEKNSMSYTDKFNIRQTGLDSFDTELAAVKDNSLVDALRMNKEQLGRLTANKLHSLYMLMAQAKNYELVLMKRGKNYSELSPVRITKDGTVEIMPTEKELENRPHDPNTVYEDGKNYTYSETNYYNKAEKGVNLPNAQDPDYIKKLEEATETAAIKFILNESEGVIANEIEEASVAAMNSDVSVQQFLNTVKENIPGTDIKLSDEINEAARNGGFKPFKIPEVNSRDFLKRMLLQEKAYMALAEVSMSRQISHFAYYNALNDNLIKEDIDTLKERIPGFNGVEQLPTAEELEELFDNKRTLARFLFEGSDDNYAFLDNAEKAILFSGANIARNDPERDKKIKQQRADLVNDMMRKILDNEIPKLFNDYTDAELVDNYVDICRYTYFVSNIGQITGDSLFVDNEFIDHELFARLNDISNAANTMAFHLGNRMSLIANPIYCKNDITAFFNPQNATTISTININMQDGNDKQTRRLRQFFTTASSCVSMEKHYIADKIRYKASPAMGMNINDLVVSDENGTPIENVEDFTDYGKGKPMFVYNRFNPNYFVSFRLNDKGAIETVDMSKLPKVKVNGEKKTFVSNFKTIIEGITQSNRNADAVLGMGGRVEIGNTLKNKVNELNDDQEIESLYNDVVTHYTKGSTQFTYESMCRILNVPENEQKLSANEINERRKLTAKAAQAQVDFVKMHFASQPDPDKKAEFFKKVGDYGVKDSVKNSLFEFFTLKNDETSKGKNNQFLENFAKAKSAQELYGIIANNLSERMKLVDKYYGENFTDADIVSKYPQMRADMTDFAMHYQMLKEFIDILKANGATVDSDLMKNADIANKKAYTVNNIIKERIDTITNLYYAYGLEKYAAIAWGNQSKVSKNGDNELDRYCDSAYVQSVYVANEYVNMIAVEALSGKAPTALYDLDGQRINPGDVLDVKKAFEQGKTLLAFGKDSTAPVAVSFNTTVYPPRASVKEAREVLKDDQKLVSITFKNMADTVEADNNLNQYQKQLEYQGIDSNFRLANLLLEHDPKNNKDYSEYIGNEIYEQLAIDLTRKQIVGMRNEDLADWVDEISIRYTANKLKANDDFKNAVNDIVKNIDKYDLKKVLTAGKTLVESTVKKYNDKLSEKSKADNKSLQSEKKKEKGGHKMESENNLGKQASNKGAVVPGSGN